MINHDRRGATEIVHKCFGQGRCEYAVREMLCKTSTPVKNYFEKSGYPEFRFSQYITTEEGCKVSSTYKGSLWNYSTNYDSWRAPNVITQSFRHSINRYFGDKGFYSPAWTTGLDLIYWRQTYAVIKSKGNNADEYLYRAFTKIQKLLPKKISTSIDTVGIDKDLLNDEIDVTRPSNWKNNPIEGEEK